MRDYYFITIPVVTVTPQTPVGHAPTLLASNEFTEPPVFEDAVLAETVPGVIPVQPVSHGESTESDAPLGFCHG